MKLVLIPLLAGTLSAQTWVTQQSGTNASLRGLSAANARVVWASGTGGTYLKTTDGGATWSVAKVPGAESLDFRDVHGVDDQTAYLLSSGTGDKARIYKTVDGGRDWKLQFTNPDPTGFFDALAFWDANHGIAVGDPVDGHSVVLTTSDGGVHWERRTTPPALAGEGSFAASGTCLIVFGKRDAWFVTGGPKAARVFHSHDRGVTWTVATTPIRNDGAAAGIFSLAFSDGRHGVAVGGDYNKANDAEHNVAITKDGGVTWIEPAGPPPAGFRSAVAYLSDRKAWIAAGPSGSDISFDGGRSWKRFDNGSYNAISFVSAKSGWAVGAGGRVAGFQF